MIEKNRGTELMVCMEDIVAGEKIRERAHRCSHPTTQKIISLVMMIDYDLFVHKNENFSSSPVFTLIVTIYDSNIRYIEESLSSAFGQSYENTEVILINNGAIGKVSDLIWKYFLNHKNAKLICTKKHLYNPSARLLQDPIPHLWNAGLFCSSGDFVYFMSYDDFISTNYAEKMVQLFLQNTSCCTAAPSLVLVNESSEINIAESEHLKKYSQREKYTNGILLAEDYMAGGNKIGFAGGLLAVKSALVLDCGGFDKNNDLSQLFKFAIHGDSGFDPNCHLYWRHHANQAHKMQRKMGLVYYRDIKEFNDIYDIKRIHQSLAGNSFAEKYERYINKYMMESTICEFKNIYSVSFFWGVKALWRIIIECPLKIQFTAFGCYLKDFKKYPQRLRMLGISWRQFFIKGQNGVHCMQTTTIKRKLVATLLKNCVKRTGFRDALLKQIRTNRFQYPDYARANFDSKTAGVDFTFIEHGYQTLPHSSYLHDISNKAVRALEAEWQATAEFRNTLPPELNCLYNYNNHYLLLTAIAKAINAERIAEIGTAAGDSLWSWLRSETIKSVSTWDIFPIAECTGWFHNTTHQKFIEEFIHKDDRWTQYVENLTQQATWDCRKNIFSNVDIIFIDGPHNGVFENTIFNNILKLKNERNILLIFDDILLSSMVDFWRDISLPKLDITSIGHQSGTGLAFLLPYQER